ncbi:MAG TPA: tetratricopeptide repeat protein, partial [Kofleriaceae bacterium]|nr:tetratricopeptide repeat protein [Kofleriaceae bacterium]
RGSRWLAAARVGALVAASASAAGVAHAAPDDDIAARLTSYEAEVRQLGADLPRANQLSGAGGPRRLLDAELAYSLGDYDAAALMLFDLAARPGPDHETACFYLAESLFQKGDKGAAAAYYEQVVSGGSVASRYYQPSLERLIEIAIVRKDETNLADHLAALDRITPALRLPSVPYVRGKLAYSQGKFDEAIGLFNEVPKGSDYELQATYYQATAYVAKLDLARASQIFTDLVGRKPRTSNDRRMVELSQLALGRLYYERDQPSKSIDAYLLVDRHSDLFPDALYEVAWVYVKSRQYDKALRALELLALSDPQSTKTPTVRILEGNLRVRKAQMIRGAQILGTIDAKEQDDPATEYDRAVQLFTETHDMYAPSHAALAHMIGAGTPPERYLAQIAGRSEHVFQAAAPLPEAAVQYLRDEPAVQRVVAVEGDLEEIHADLAGTAATVARLEGVLAAGDRAAVYPGLAGRRTRIAAIESALIKLRSDLAEQALRLVASSGELAALTANRRQRVAAFAAMPDPQRAAETHALENRGRYDAIEQSATEVESAIGATQAISVALRKYATDARDLPAEQTRGVTAGLDDAAREAEAIEDELDQVHRELQIGRDLAAVGDPSAATAAQVRAQVRSAEDAEHKLLAGLAQTSRDRDQSRRLAAAGDRAARLADQLTAAEHQIDGAIDQGLQEVRGTLAEARATLAAYQRELAEHEAESRSIGGSVLGASLQAVVAKFYDIVIRSDVGSVDVAWSQKEDVDDDLKRLNLSRQRELKQLRDEFKDILDAGTPKPSAPARKPEPAAEPAPATGSPDKAEGDQRVAPGARPGAPASPTVKPDAKKPAARSSAKPAGKGGSR